MPRTSPYTALPTGLLDTSDWLWRSPRKFRSDVLIGKILGCDYFFSGWAHRHRGNAHRRTHDVQ
ncbi:hypothetical protein HETIRDRAFT_407338 [Heterobasidion irregulare TC 32-1]|uniref:Uncharacterized protein n=1 Tax=Heterobasidion irregulare (strain TC 32-1) TaxID=747525 RepID=W4KJ05_HETIT|nr:uncharacterized protein HETIRDRAFT_407338 [Heterobasidion irregulare TC 32-1]ETW85056.1 hypothetical protein HETIRDRAFT_407338 [Heterobasidion irregulare TC 32-1]